MDAKSLKHRKRSKKNKSRDDKGNGDVLVVPPDILKKLGISIGNICAGLQIPDSGNNQPSTGVVNNEVIANNSLLQKNFDEKSKESSILETASLMKKSVFLSPTFVPTVANVIPGEVEIANTQKYDDPTLVRKTCLKYREINNDLAENISDKESKQTHEPSQNCSKIDINTDLRLNGVSTNIPNVNGDFLQISTKENSAQWDQGEDNMTLKEIKAKKSDYLLTASLKDTSTKTKINGEQISNNANVNGVFLNKSSRSSMHQDKANNSPIYFQQKIHQKAQNEAQEKNTPPKKTAMGTKLDNGKKDLVNLKGSATQLVEVDTNIVSLKGSLIQGKAINTGYDPISNTQIESEINPIEPTKIAEELNQTVGENIHISSEENVTQIEKAEVEHKTNALQSSNQVTKNASSTEKNAMEIPQQLENNISIPTYLLNVEQADTESNPMPLERISVLEKEGDVTNNIIPLDHTSVHIELDSNDLLTLDESIILTEENTLISLDDISVQIKQTEGENDFSSISIEHDENNLISLEDLQLNLVDNNNILVDDRNMIQKIYKKYLKDLLITDDKLMLAELDMDSDLTINETCSSLPINKDHLSQISEKGSRIVTEKSETKLKVNNVVLSNTTEAEGHSKDSSAHQNGHSEPTEKCDSENTNTTEPANKIAQKINIISEEIIPHSDLKELARSKSPLLKNLTSVPLNAIIAPKKSIENIHVRNSEISITVKTNPVVFLDGQKLGSKKILESEDLSNINIAPYSNQVDKVYNTAENEPPKDEKNKSETTIGYVNLNLNSILKIDKKNSINNNNITASSHIVATTHHCSENVKNYDITRGSEDEQVETKEIDCISKLCIPLQQEVLQHDNICADKEQTVKKIDDKIAFGEKKYCKEGKSKDISKLNLKSKADKAEVSEQINVEKKKRKKKKRPDEKYKVEKSIKDSEDKLFSDAHLHNILKSSKENSNTNNQVDKVKEIAEYIKKCAHIFKQNKKEVMKDIIEDSRKETINHQTNIIKSKLCIQGVEKPGGSSDKTKHTKETKVLKTYTRQKKQQKLCPTKNVTKESGNDTCDVIFGSEIDLNSVNVSTLQKTQDFCLCYDFGHLDDSDYDNSYEHLHFCYRENYSDLETIFSIYNNEDGVINYRTEIDFLDNIETLEDKTKSHSICWNYFLNDDKEDIDNGATHVEKQTRDVSVIDETDAISHQDKVNNALVVNNDNISEILDKNPDEKITMGSTNTARAKDLSSGTCSNTQTLVVPGKTNLKNVDKDSNKMITVVTVVEPEDPKLDVSKRNKALTGVATDRIKQAVHKGVSEPSSSHMTKNFAKPGVPLADNVKVKTVISDKNKKDYDEQVASTSKTSQKKGYSPKNDTSNNSQKRKLSRIDLLNDNDQPPAKKSVKCGVCQKLLPESGWQSHVANAHNFIAWRSGETFNFNDADLKKKLREKLQSSGSLKCCKCSLQTKKFDKYLQHVEFCVGQKDATSRRATRDEVICGVCFQYVQIASWVEHMGKDHDYMAWIEGNAPLNSDDEIAVSKHLLNVIRMSGQLLCYKCGTTYRRAKLYMCHATECKSSQDKSASDKTASESTATPDKKAMTCAVCKQTVPVTEWMEHIGRNHNYLSWEEGAAALDVNNEEAVWRHLREIIKRCDGLMCYKCGLNRRRVNLYLEHVEVCAKSPTETQVVCAVCHKKMNGQEWRDHISKEHLYLAWQVGGTPVNYKDEGAIKAYLVKIAIAFNGLVCGKCGVNNKYPKTYVLHVKECDGALASTNALFNTLYQADQRDHRVKCGVCEQSVSSVDWIHHIANDHNYMAWQQGEEPFKLEDEEAVKAHLNTVCDKVDGLICNRCGIHKKTPNPFIKHIKECTETPEGNQQAQFVTCAVCRTKVADADWYEHICNEHNYLAWQLGFPRLDVNNAEAVKEHLQHIIRHSKGLKCAKCGIIRRQVKVYLSHVEKCAGLGEPVDESTDSINLNESYFSEHPQRMVKCGVCAQNISSLEWFDHLGKEHQYMAWLDGDEPLIVDDEDALKEVMMKISKQRNGLICNKCGISKKYPKTFIQHIKNCKGMPITVVPKTVESVVNLFDVSDVTTETVTCGVCNKEILTNEWMAHFENDHHYMAWLDGKPPLKLDNKEEVQKHLNEVVKFFGGLKCRSCGIVRKYVRNYMQHIEECGPDGLKWKTPAESPKAVPKSAISVTGSVECAVCHEVVEYTQWRQHAMDKHYNVAWTVGAAPIAINNPYGVEPYIKQYKAKKGKLVCKTCGISRVSAVGFYAHIITCGKTEEEMDIYRERCEICTNKYLCIYKSQHMTAHREAEYAQLRRQYVAEEKQLKKKMESMEVEIVGGRRKAAEKAQSVIEKYTSNSADGPNCSKCGFFSEIEAEMANHECIQNKFEDADSDDSLELGASSDDDDSDIDSNISDEEREAQDVQRTKSKKHGESAAYKIQRLPYQIKNLNTYIKSAAEEFVDLHLTDKELFTEWRSFDHTMISQDEISKYIPPIEESCKIRYKDNDDWKTCKRMEATKGRDMFTIFSGGCIQTISWVPCLTAETSRPMPQYLSILTHLDSDLPRHFWYEKPEAKPMLIQIWNCGNLMSDVPEFVMGLVLECGPIWSMDWCPSGARDVFNPNDEIEGPKRLGLLAATSIHGAAHIYAVPDPSTVTKEGQLFYKLKPIVELKFAMKPNREVYQATSVRWSTQKGHTHIVLGYSDGTTAYYNLKIESPLLRSTQNGVTILYPYYDERSQIVCIEDMDIFPSRRGSLGAVAAGSVGGARVAPLAAHAAAARVLFPPHWPAALLAGDDNLVSQAVNELDWYGVGRRVGPMRSCCGCLWCGRVAAANAPNIRLMRAHPAYNDLHRQVIATIQMIPFGNKRKRKNDELGMIMEPLTYKDVIAKYGIEFTPITVKDKISQQRLSGMPRETFPERFPLSDVCSMAFCPTSRHHNKLAIATHAGLVFIISV